MPEICAEKVNILFKLDIAWCTQAEGGYTPSQKWRSTLTFIHPKMEGN